MMKKLALGIASLGVMTIAAYAATPGTDNAGNYGGGWSNGSNGGTGFAAWNLTGNNNGGGNFAGYFIGDSTSGSGNINNPAGDSFGVFANPSAAFANADRGFDSALTVGETFSLDMAVNFRNGNKGFNLYTGGTGGTQLFNFNVGSDLYSINGTDTGLAYSATSVFHLAFTQTSLAGGTYSVNRGASVFTGTYTGDADSFRLYNSGTNGGGDGAADDLYFNNLAITAVPEPGTILSFLSGSSLLGGLMFIRRRRS